MILMILVAEILGVILLGLKFSWWTKLESWICNLKSNVLRIIFGLFWIGGISFLAFYCFMMWLTCSPCWWK